MPNQPTEYSIGKIAKLSGFSIDTIRYYEQLGLLPEPERRPSGYRYYTDNVLTQLRFIHNAKDLGFTLQEIEQLIALSRNSDQGVKEIRQQTELHLKNVERRIYQLKKVQHVLSHLVDACPGHGATEQCPIIQALVDDAPLMP